jgi:hypothetical protein
MPLAAPRPHPVGHARPQQERRGRRQVPLRAQGVRSRDPDPWLWFPRVPKAEQPPWPLGLCRFVLSQFFMGKGFEGS